MVGVAEQVRDERTARMVLSMIDDPDDPTPYWLVSSRHPELVLAALKRD